MRNVLGIAAVAVLVLAACASNDEGATQADGSSSSEQTLPTVPPGDATTSVPDDPRTEPGDPAPPSDGTSEDLPRSSEIDDMVDAAVADLAHRLSVDGHAITIVSVESVTWPNGAMGCPEPGMSYTQALVEGVRVELTVDGTPYWYHQGGSNPIRYCADPREPVDGSPEA